MCSNCLWEQCFHTALLRPECHRDLEITTENQLESVMWCGGLQAGEPPPPPLATLNWLLEPRGRPLSSSADCPWQRSEELSKHLAAVPTDEAVLPSGLISFQFKTCFTEFKILLQHQTRLRRIIDAEMYKPRSKPPNTKTAILSWGGGGTARGSGIYMSLILAEQLRGLQAASALRTLQQR